jgi:hypothetical protein
MRNATDDEQGRDYGYAEPESGVHRRRPRLRLAEQDEADLAWYYDGAAAAFGFHGVSYAAFSGGGTHDEAAMNELHHARLDTRHRASVDRERRIGRALALVDSFLRADLEAAFIPNNFDPALQRELCCGRKSGTLAGLALRTRACHLAYAAWARARKPVRPDADAPSLSTLREFLTFEARRATARRALAPLRDATVLRLRQAMKAYREAADRAEAEDAAS